MNGLLLLVVHEERVFAVEVPEQADKETIRTIAVKMELFYRQANFVKRLLITLPIRTISTPAFAAPSKTSSTIDDFANRSAVLITRFT